MSIARDVVQFGRMSVLGPTLLLVVIGLAAGHTPGAAAWGAAILAGLLFHIGVYVMNDVCDAEIDRTDPRRSGMPVASGRIGTRTAALASAAALVAGGLVAGAAGAPAWYALAVLGLGVYNLYGKRCPLPPVTDAAQGVGWGALVLLGSALAGGVTAGTVLLALSVACYIAVVTAVQGGLRDLANDRRHGARTTAVWFLPADRLTSPYIAYVLVTHGLGSAACVAGIAVHGGGAAATTAGLLGQSGCLALLWTAMRHYRAGHRRVWLAGLVHLMLFPLTAAVVVAVSFGVVPLLVVTVLILIAWLSGRVARSLLTKDTWWMPEP